MNPALIVSLVSGVLAATAIVIAAWLGFRGQSKAAAAQKDVGVLDASIDGLNDTVATLRSELTLTRSEVKAWRERCEALEENGRTMLRFIREKHPGVDLDLKAVPHNGY